MKFKKIDDSLDPKLNLNQHCTNSLERWSKEYCLKTVFRGAQKMVSNNATLEFYNELDEGTWLVICDFISVTFLT